jgi:hypothetical protein
MKYIRSIAQVFLLSSLYGCSEPETGTPVGFVSVLSGGARIDGVLGNSKLESFHSQLAFEKVAMLYTADTVPEIDFATNQIVLVDLGERTSGGYSIRVDSIYESEGALSINATEIKPGSTCFVTTAMMTPYVFLKVFSVGRVEAISWKSEVIDCNQK